MKLIRVVRAIGGLLAILTLLTMILGDFLYPSLSVTPEMIGFLLALISGLLGIDIMRKRLPIKVKLGEKGKEK